MWITYWIKCKVKQNQSFCTKQLYVYYCMWTRFSVLSKNFSAFKASISTSQKLLCGQLLHDVPLCVGFFLRVFGTPLAVFTVVRRVLCMNRDHMALKSWRVCSTVFTVLTLIDFSATVCLHMLSKLPLLAISLLTFLTLKHGLFCVKWENMVGQHKGICNLKVTLRTLK